MFGFFFFLIDLEEMTSHSGDIYVLDDANH